MTSERSGTMGEQTPVQRELAQAMAATIARSSPAVRAACGMTMGEQKYPQLIAFGAMTSDQQEAHLSRVAAMEEALKGLLDAIHDSMTHESQQHHADAIASARRIMENRNVQ